jgi:para-nitrobenzyl esterase
MGTVVETRCGKVEGFERERVQVFRGIPFAAPPVGELRFRSPEPPEPWSGVRSAAEFGASAPQRDLPIPIFPGWDVGRQDEDCLYLNVTTPAADGGRRPVLVWIHGGGFTMGSGSQAMYDVVPLVCRGDVVVVTVNYRLGPLGFLHLDDLVGQSFGASGNAGIEDQVAALEWVRDNIAAFGGDPDQVTIFGESAGGMSVGTLLGTPSAAGLFRGAVAQSGAAHNVYTGQAASRIAEIVLDSLGVAPGDAGRLREVTTEQLLQAHDRVTLHHMGRPGAVLLPFQPVVDGEVLPKPPIEAVAEGLSAEVAVLVGSTRDEWNLFGIMDPRQSSLNEVAVTARLEAAVGGEAKRLLQVYRSARAEVADLSPRDLYFAIGGAPGRGPEPPPAAHLPVPLHLGVAGRGPQSMSRHRHPLRVRVGGRGGGGALLGLGPRGARPGRADHGRLAGLRAQRRPKPRKPRRLARLRHRAPRHDAPRRHLRRGRRPLRRRTPRLGGGWEGIL